MKTARTITDLNQRFANSIKSLTEQYSNGSLQKFGFIESVLATQRLYEKERARINGVRRGY